MEQQNKLQEEKFKRVKKQKKHLLHYLFIYLICLLAACVTWLLVRYSMREESVGGKDAQSSLAISLTEEYADGEVALYV